MAQYVTSLVVTPPDIMNPIIPNTGQKHRLPHSHPTVGNFIVKPNVSMYKMILAKSFLP